MGAVEPLGQLGGSPLFLGVGRMQIGVVSLEKPPPCLPYRVDVGTIRQLEVGVVARQLRILRRVAPISGRPDLRSWPGRVSDGPPVLSVRGAPARTSDPGDPPPHTQPRCHLAPQHRANAPQDRHDQDNLWRRPVRPARQGCNPAPRHQSDVRPLGSWSGAVSVARRHDHEAIVSLDDGARFGIRHHVSTPVPQDRQRDHAVLALQVAEQVEKGPPR